jgi:hypothetical protein
MKGYTPLSAERRAKLPYYDRPVSILLAYIFITYL